MNPILLSGLISGASELFTNIANGVSQRRANKINQQNYKELRAYNAPGAQMSRFRQAGLNPNLIYTQSNEAEPAPAWESPKYDIDLGGLSAVLGAYQNVNESNSRIVNLKKTNDLMDAQISNLLAQKGLTEEQIKQVKATITQIEETIKNMHWEQNYKTYEQLLDTIYKNQDLKIKMESLNLSRAELAEKIREFDLENPIKKWFADVFNSTIAKGDFTDRIISFLKGLFELNFNLNIGTPHIGGGSF